VYYYSLYREHTLISFLLLNIYCFIANFAYDNSKEALGPFGVSAYGNFWGAKSRLVSWDVEPRWWYLPRYDWYHVYALSS